MFEDNCCAAWTGRVTRRAAAECHDVQEKKANEANIEMEYGRLNEHGKTCTQNS